jgi:hypothetical protein
MAFVIDRFDRQGCSPLELSLPPVRPSPREHWRAGVDTKGRVSGPGESAAPAHQSSSAAASSGIIAVSALISALFCSTVDEFAVIASRRPHLGAEAGLPAFPPLAFVGLEGKKLQCATRTRFSLNRRPRTASLAAVVASHATSPLR